MKLFYETSYRIYNERAKTPLKFLVLSDIHFSASMPEERLQLCAEKASKQKPDYILIPGDLIDFQDDIDNPKILAHLTAWLEQLGRIAPTIVSLGNHDYYRVPPKGKKGWLTQFPSQLFSAISPLENVHLLNNVAFEDNKVYIYGLTLSEDYYQLDHIGEKKPTIARPGSENKAVLLRDLNSIPQEELHKLPVKKARIALVHSPVYLEDEDVRGYFEDFDLIISGHMHNGAVPPVLHDFWRSSKGIIAPGKALFPKHARSTLSSAQNKNIICGAVTTIHDNSRVAFLNHLFPIFITNIELSKNIIYKRRPNIKNKYVNPKKS